MASITPRGPFIRNTFRTRGEKLLPVKSPFAVMAGAAVDPLLVCGGYASAARAHRKTDIDMTEPAGAL